MRLVSWWASRGRDWDEINVMVGPLNVKLEWHHNRFHKSELRRKAAR